MKTRQAAQNDLRTIQDLNHGLFESDNRFFGDLKTSWPYEEGEAYFKKGIEDDDRVIFVAEEESGIVGYLYGRIVPDFPAYLGKRAELDNMFVEEGSRSQGVGGLLVDAFKQWAESQHVDVLVVSAFFPNERAIDFYRRRGFASYAMTLTQKLK